MIYKAIKGSKIPIVIEVDGLGIDLNLNDTNVGLEVTFFCIRPMERYEEPKTVSYSKSDTNSLFEMPDGDGNQYIALVDTSQLDTGRLACGVKVTYTDAEIGKQVIEISPSECDLKIIDPYNTGNM